MNTTPVTTAGQLIHVDDEVFGELQKRATPLVDDANAVLRRVLGLEGAADVVVVVAAHLKAPGHDNDGRRNGTIPKRGAKRPPRGRTKWTEPKRSRARKGTLLPEAQYEIPLLESLVELGGQAPSSDVIGRLGKKLDGKLTGPDREAITSGDVRWRNRAQFVRLGLVKRGLMDKNSPRGTWVITSAGRGYLKEVGNDG